MCNVPSKRIFIVVEIETMNAYTRACAHTHTHTPQRQATDVVNRGRHRLFGGKTN